MVVRNWENTMNVTMYLIIEETSASGKAIRVGERIWLPLSCCKVTPILDMVTRVRSKFVLPAQAERNGWTRASYYVLNHEGEFVTRTRQKALVTMPLAVAVAKFSSLFETLEPWQITEQAKNAAKRDIGEHREDQIRVVDGVGPCPNTPVVRLLACDRTV